MRPGLNQDVTYTVLAIAEVCVYVCVCLYFPDKQGDRTVAHLMEYSSCMGIALCVCGRGGGGKPRSDPDKM